MIKSFLISELKTKHDKIDSNPLENTVESRLSGLDGTGPISDHQKSRLHGICLKMNLQEKDESESRPSSMAISSLRKTEQKSGSNEIADALAKAGASVPSAPLTYLELFSRAKSRNKTIWLVPPVQHWFQGSRPGGCLSIDCSRRDQTTLTRFLSGHIRSLTFSDDSKCFETCPKCTAEQATPDHILACLGLSKQDLVSNPLLTLDFFRVHRLMDLIQLS
ncbi:hypothetical protein AVEN_115997-1 [Araneus ventricosus]|uniref:Uncharacterized protein n=1 Tax=Araneus ventricosus TaxID=182803 RepID=A0A4Y2EMU7_ARAVE|nr:hypothetical protein AVEN_115997-1 [Araneus ventricosus]